MASLRSFVAVPNSSFHRIHASISSQRRPVRIRATLGTEQSVRPAITLSTKALHHLNKMKTDLSQDLCLRVGVRQGGCSGMSYTMDFEQRANIRADDSIIDHEGFTMELQEERTPGTKELRLVRMLCPWELQAIMSPPAHSIH